MTKTTKKPKVLADLEMNDCRWPIGDPRQEGFHFCGARQIPGRPYCDAHWQMSFVTAKPRHAGASVAPMLLPMNRRAA